ncbi:type III PLP-dependent enzyme [Thalassovita sp.]|uniref:type III PLP-dependent enzyme n=1 Tax=Thalassovita sp. TaxID=1979401 RepID=UPI0029DE5BC5|nr:type III PLP-dependent enzyme [Thalassovita sp.]
MRPEPYWLTPLTHLKRHRPDHAVMYFSPTVLQAQAQRFIQGFPGLVTYAVKANTRPEVLVNLVAAGVTGFDVASPPEMWAVRDVCPDAVLHYNNPVRTPEEVREALRAKVASASVDSLSELEKLAPLGPIEVSVRLALPVKGAAYDFGEKFGVGPDAAVDLLQEVARRGHVPAITFHPGTQCRDPEAWVAYIRVAAEVSKRAGVPLARLNVGGGFASHWRGPAPDLERVFARIGEVTREVFDTPPALVCEPGRALVAESFTLATRVKALRPNGAVFLNDGIYGALSELRDICGNDRVQVICPDGLPRAGDPVRRVAFGPTCDSLDRLPEPIPFPSDTQEGDYVLFSGMGAYSLAISTRFNGYGLGDPVTVASL